MRKASSVLVGSLVVTGLLAVLMFAPTLVGADRAMAYSVTPASFTVKTSQYNTNVRSGPGLSHSIVRKIAPRSQVACGGWTYGDCVTDLWLGTPDYRWYKIAGLSEWVASGVVIGNAPGSSPVPPNPAPSHPPQSSRTAKAIAWACSMIGRSSFPLCGGGTCQSYMYCAKFAANAYGSRSAGFATAQALYNWERSQNRLHTSGTPELGALCFYRYGSYGHVAIYIGGGKVVGAGEATIKVKAYSQWGSRPYLGWAPPPASWHGR